MTCLFLLAQVGCFKAKYQTKEPGNARHCVFFCNPIDATYDVLRIPTWITTFVHFQLVVSYYGTSGHRSKANHGTRGDWETAKLNDNPTRQRKGTLQGTNVSHQKSLLKMIFLFPRWDMLIPWGVLECAISKATTDHYYRNHYLSSYLSYSYADAYSESYSELIFIFIFIGCIILFSYAYHIQSNCGAYG